MGVLVQTVRVLPVAPLNRSFGADCTGASYGSVNRSFGADCTGAYYGSVK